MTGKKFCKRRELKGLGHAKIKDFYSRTEEIDKTKNRYGI